MHDFNRFGNMMPPTDYMLHSYHINRPPFHMAGNVYYVGNEWCCSHLIDTGDGLILLDVPTYSGLAGLIQNIWSLGFRPDQIKYILISHAHGDHFGCVKALTQMTGAKTIIGAVDGERLKNGSDSFLYVNPSLGDERFEPDFYVNDGDVVELGNTKIRCILTPGHTIGVMSHFWTTKHKGRIINVGVYGGAGFVSVSKDALEKNGYPISMQKAFSDSIDKVWAEPVDMMLGNHPFHNDTFLKYQKMCNGDEEAFIDPTEWHRFLTELKSRYYAFLKMSPEEIKEMYAESQFLDYYPHDELHTG